MWQNLPVFRTARPTYFALLFLSMFWGLAGCASPCSADDDCPDGMRCVSSGGVFFGNAVCVDTGPFSDVASPSPDVGPTDAGEVGSDADDVDPDDVRVPDASDMTDVPVCDPPESCDPVAEVHIQQIGTCLRRESGVVACWGSNARGRLGNDADSNTHELRPVIVVDPDDRSAPFIASQICSSESSNCALDESGTIHCWGMASSIGIGAGADDTTRNAVPRRVISGDSAFPEKTFEQLVCDFRSTCAIDSEGGLWCWGDANDGATNPASPESHVATATPIDLPDPVVDASLGFATACAVTAPGDLYCWGTNLSDNLGTPLAVDEVSGPTVVNIPAPVVDVSSQDFTSCALTEDDRLYCWGLVEGLIDQTTQTSTPTAIPLPAPPDEMGVGRQAVCIRAGTDVYCWGQRTRGLVGDGVFVPGGLVDPVLAPTRVEAIPAAESLFVTEHGVCIIADGLPWCWGSNTFGQLGRDDIVLHPDPVRVAMPDGVMVRELLANNSGICALSMQDDLFCWGGWPPGLQTSPDTFAIGAPTSVPLSGVTSLGHTPWEPLAVSDGRVYRLGRDCCGDRVAELRGFSDVVEVAATNREGCLIDDSRALLCDGEDRATAWLGLSPTALTAGVDFFCARESDTDELWCWGGGSWGQLGTGGTPSVADDPSRVEGLGSVARFDAGWDHACAIRADDGVVYCWGSNDMGQVGVPADVQSSVLLPSEVTLPRPAVDVSAGWRYSCAVLDDHQVWCWGANDFRQAGGTESSHVPARVSDISATRVFAASSSTTFAIDEEDPEVLWCWGTGGYGACGTGDEVYSATPKPIRDIGPYPAEP